VDEAMDAAIRRNPRTSKAIFAFLRETLLLQNIYEFPEHERGSLIEFLMKFQQITGPVMAKSVEDTVFYIYNRLVSLNEVGGNPEQFGIGVDDFHKHNAWHWEHWQHTMTALSTHDTKRSEDVRARLNVLSEIPGEWEAAIWRWREITARSKTKLDGVDAPDLNDEYLLYQTLVGALPLDFDPADDATRDQFRERVAGYMQKAINEAKIHTSWINSSEAYNTAMGDLVAGAFASKPFWDAFLPFARRVTAFGQYNALAQTLLKFLSPGIPDTYQGNELWDFSLVDPDNRRPVDYAIRRKALDTIRARMGDDPAMQLSLAQDLLRGSLSAPMQGWIKLYVTHIALRTRNQYPDVMAEGAYTPVKTGGAKAKHLCAFTRSLGETALLCAVPVLIVELTGGAERPPIGGEVWQDTRLLLPKGSATRYRNLFTGEVLTARDGALPAHEVFGHFPVALLEAI
jgi:(1->4)-alpha-D-glucan 1-alpha-D-glucosylmutase